jgi:hypothetical protein
MYLFCAFFRKHLSVLQGILLVFSSPQVRHHANCKYGVSASCLPRQGTGSLAPHTLCGIRPPPARSFLKAEKKKGAASAPFFSGCPY